MEINPWKPDMTASEQMAARLYRVMPGAPPVPREGREERWGDVMGNQHWAFCLAVVKMAQENRPVVNHIL